MNAWVLMDSTSQCVYIWKLYAWKEWVNNRKGLAHRVVLDLFEGLAGKGYNLFMNNFYSSPAPYHDLAIWFGTCGTIRVNHKGLSDTFKQKGECIVKTWVRKCFVWNGKTRERYACYQHFVMTLWFKQDDMEERQLMVLKLFKKW